MNALMGILIKLFFMTFVHYLYLKTTTNYKSTLITFRIGK